MKTARQFYNRFFSSERNFVREIRDISGFTPSEIFLYKLSLTHSSSVRNAGKKGFSNEEFARSCNERLEFLGDSIIDSVIAEYLFKIYPLKDEGFLTEMRSKIVNRKKLNELSKKIGLDPLIRHSINGSLNEAMYGDALEAFVGAVYLDLGYKCVRKFIHQRIIDPHIDLGEVEAQIISYKNMLIEHVQKNKLGMLNFAVKQERGDGRNKIFVVEARVGKKVLGQGEGRNKKSAEQQAAEHALLKLELIVH